MANDRVIGYKNTLPWKLPADMSWFVSNTKGKPVVMGRKTYESFGAKPLKERLNIVVTRNSSYEANGASVAKSVDEGISLAIAYDEIMIIGGGSFYEQTINRADRLYITHVHASIEGDTWFPEYNLSDWNIVIEKELKKDEKNEYDCTFQILDRKY